MHSINDSNTQILHLVLVFTSLKGLFKTRRRDRKRATKIISAETPPGNDLMGKGWIINTFYLPLLLSFMDPCPGSFWQASCHPKTDAWNRSDGSLCQVHPCAIGCPPAPTEQCHGEGWSEIGSWFFKHYWKMMRRKWAEKMIEIAKEFLLLFFEQIKHSKKGIKGVRWHARNMIISLEILLKIIFHWLKPKKRRKILSAWVSILIVWLIRKKRLYFMYIYPCSFCTI